MNALLLSAGAAGANDAWWQLILPFWVLAAIAYVISLTVRFIKKIKARRQERMHPHEDAINDFMAPIDNPAQDQV